MKMLIMAALAPWTHEMDSTVTSDTSYGDIVTSLYLGILGRQPDAGGFKSSVSALQGGMPLSELAKSMIDSAEFSQRRGVSINNKFGLPNLIDLYPDKYLRSDQDYWVFDASHDSDFTLLESLIAEHRYYDSFGIWGHEIDLDKRITAAIACGLGAKSCIEFGCFNGPALSILKDRGLDVCGVEVSHLAMTLAYPNIYKDIRFGDLCALEFQRTFDLFLAMDILEHISPLKVDQYVKRISDLIGGNGLAYINSPAYGDDTKFGPLFKMHDTGCEDRDGKRFWRHIRCDDKGWPLHGHLIWANEAWWESLFFKHGLVRDRGIEEIINQLLANFFYATPGRKTFYVLRHSKCKPDISEIENRLKTNLLPLMEEL